AVGKFYKTFKAKCPKGTLADFARQFDKTVPFTAAGTDDEPGYKKHAMYCTLDNMFRYMPDIVVRKKQSAADIAEAKTARKARLRDAEDKRERGERLLVALCNQIGLPASLLAVGFQRVGYSQAEVDELWSRKNTLFDVGLKDFMLAVRTGPNAGLPAAKAIA